MCRAVQQLNRLRGEVLGQNIAADSLAVSVHKDTHAAPARLDLAQAMVRLRIPARAPRATAPPELAESAVAGDRIFL